MVAGRFMVVAWLVGLLAPCARAVPPDRVVHLAAGDVTIQPAPPGSWQAVSTDESVVKAKYFDTHEVSLEGVGEGLARVVLLNPVLGSIQVWRIRVGTEVEHPRDPGTIKWPAACACTQARNQPLHCQVTSQECVAALRLYLQRNDLSARQIWIKYDLNGLQALLKDLEGAVRSAGFEGISLAFAGANLRVKGKVADRESYRRLLLTLYGTMVGRMLLEDRIEIERKDSPANQDQGGGG